jgi:hypothetical protein
MLRSDLLPALLAAVATALLTAAPSNRRGLADDAPAPRPDLEALVANAEGISPVGRPENYSLADQARFFIWQDQAGWHFRTTGPAQRAHGFRGAIRLHGARFQKVIPVGLDNRNDSYQLAPGQREVTFKFATSNKFDGVDFYLDKAASGHVEFEVLLNGGKAPRRIFVGSAAANPKTNHFAVAIP